MAALFLSAVSILTTPLPTPLLKKKSVLRTPNRVLSPPFMKKDFCMLKAIENDDQERISEVEAKRNMLQLYVCPNDHSDASFTCRGNYNPQTQELSLYVKGEVSVQLNFTKDGKSLVKEENEEVEHEQMAAVKDAVMCWVDESTADVMVKIMQKLPPQMIPMLAALFISFSLWARGGDGDLGRSLEDGKQDSVVMEKENLEDGGPGEKS